MTATVLKETERRTERMPQNRLDQINEKRIILFCFTKRIMQL